MPLRNEKVLPSAPSFAKLGPPYGPCSTPAPLTPAPLNFARSSRHVRFANRARQIPVTTGTAPQTLRHRFNRTLLFLLIHCHCPGNIPRLSTEYVSFSYILSLYAQYILLQINTNTSVPPHNLATAIRLRLSYFYLYQPPFHPYRVYA